MNLDELAEAVLQRLQPRALLVGERPLDYHKYNYVNEEPYEAVVIGQLSAGELLHMPNDAVCDALLEGKPVYLCKQTFPATHAKRLYRELEASQRHLLELGVQPMEHKLITAETARRFLMTGERISANSRLTPLARDILEGKAEGKSER